jgi:hypothetical protein
MEVLEKRKEDKEKELDSRWSKRMALKMEESGKHGRKKRQKVTDENWENDPLMTVAFDV